MVCGFLYKCVYTIWMSDQNWFTGIQGHKISKPLFLGKFFTIVSCESCVTHGREFLTWFDSKGFSSRYRSTRFEYEQDYPKGMQANSTGSFHGGDDAGTEMAHAHSHLRTCACTHPRIHASPARAHICTHTCTHTCVHRYTRKYTVHARAHVNTRTCALTHACTNPSKRANKHAHACTNACIQP